MILGQQFHSQSFGLGDKWRQLGRLDLRGQIFDPQREFDGFLFATIDQLFQLVADLLGQLQMPRSFVVDRNGQDADEGWIGGHCSAGEPQNQSCLDQSR